MPAPHVLSASAPAFVSTSAGAQPRAATPATNAKGKGKGKYIPPAKRKLYAKLEKERAAAAEAARATGANATAGGSSSRDAGWKHKQRESSTEPRYVDGVRRHKHHRQVAFTQEISPFYLSQATMEPDLDKQTPAPMEDTPLLILDLNHTLVARRKRSSKGSKVPVARPYLSTFLEYILGCEDAPAMADANGDGAVGAGASDRNSSSGASTEQKPLRRWEVAVYSSARERNVRSMCRAIRLVAIEDEYSQSAGGRTHPGEALRAIWSREMMGLSKADFNNDVETVKDLDKLWEGLDGGRWNADRSVLLDDEAAKAALQPYNHLKIDPFDATGVSREASPAVSADGAEREVTPTAQTCDSSDDALLRTIALLELLRSQRNVAHFIFSGALARVEEDTSRDLVQEGKDVCERLGIPISVSFDTAWWDRVQPKRQRASTPPLELPASSESEQSSGSGEEDKTDSAVAHGSA